MVIANLLQRKTLAGAIKLTKLALLDGGFEIFNVREYDYINYREEELQKMRESEVVC